MHIKANYTAKVQRVIDGDTILIYIQCPTCGDGKQLRLRLARIDAPDKGKHPPAMVNASTQYLRKLVESKDCVIMLSQKWPDKYGRLVGEVYLGEKNISNVMLGAGMARLYSTRSPKPLAGHVASNAQTDFE